MYRYVSVPKPGGPEVLEIKEGEVPEPKAGEVRINVEAAGVAFPDTMIRFQTMSPDVYPVTLGYDAVGIVDKLGEGVTGLTVGQRVLRVWEEGRGGYAEMLCHPARDLAVVPTGIEPGAAVSVGLNGVMAYQMVHRLARVVKNEQVLVHAAAGGIGHLIVQLCRLAGATVYGTASTRKQSAVEAMGAIPIDYRQEDFETRIKDLTKEGVDVAFDCVGGAYLEKSFRALRITGRLITYGAVGTISNGVRNEDLFKKHRENPVPWSAQELIRNSKLVAGYAFYCMKTEHPDLFPEDLSTMLDLVAKQSIKPIMARACR